MVLITYKRKKKKENGKIEKNLQMYKKVINKSIQTNIAIDCSILLILFFKKKIISITTYIIDFHVIFI